MADNPAHVPAGPESQAVDVDGSTGESSEDTPSAISDTTDLQADAVTPETNPDDVELVGWASTAVARLGEADTPPILVGAAFAHVEELSSTHAGTSAPGFGARPSPNDLDDLPVWSFRDAPLGNREPGPPEPADQNQAELPFARAAAP